MLLNLLYLVLMVVLAPWWLYRAWFFGKGTLHWRERFWGLVPERAGDRPCVWLHAVSLGEVNLLKTLLPAIERELPDVECVISTGTETGLTHARSLFPERIVFLAPWDFTWAMEAAFDRLRPDALVLTELEVWPNWLSVAEQRGVPAAVVNGRLGDASFTGYQRLAWLLQPRFASLAAVGAQNYVYGERFVALGVPGDRVTTTGSIKFDGAETDRANGQSAQFAKRIDLEEHEIVFCAGSTQPEEAVMAIQVFQRLAVEYPQLRLLLAPRHPEHFDLAAAALSAAKVSWRRRSQLDPSPLAEEKPRAILIDVVGELAAWWGLAEIAYVGGSQGSRGGQNMIEPAAYGAAVSFGPHTRNFADVVELLLASDAAEVVPSEQALEAFVRRCLEDPEWASELGAQARELVLEQRGATVRTIHLLRALLPARTERRLAA